jgi:hypothetical protein
MWPWIAFELLGKYYIVGDEWREVSKKEFDEFNFKRKAELTPRGYIWDSSHPGVKEEKIKKVEEEKIWKTESRSTPGLMHTVWVDSDNVLRCDCWANYRWKHCSCAKRVRNLHHLPYLMNKELEAGMTVDDIEYE